METARKGMQAAVDGGFRIIEFTLTTPGALELITEFARDENVTVGAGTVMSPKMVEQAAAAGAQFIVSPVCDPDVISECARLSLACIPAGYTPTELERAHRLKADFIKLFPAPAGGVSFVEAVLAPLPHLRLFPTNGINVENFLEYLQAGCAGVGFAGSLFDSETLGSGHFDEIRAQAERIVARFEAWNTVEKRPPAGR